MGRKSNLKKRRRNDGSDFEALVERIGRVLGPRAALIQRNEEVRDKDTGQLRELDVTIRHRVGSREVLVLFECRDRQRQADVTWIEQLATKKNSVGADLVVAVTKKPMSKPAQIKATALGIQVRCVRDLKDDEIGLMFETGIAGVTVGYTNVRIGFDHFTGTPTELVIHYADPDPVPNMPQDPEVYERLAKSGLLHTPILFDAAGKDSFTIEQLVEEAMAGGWDPVGKVSAGAEQESRFTLEPTGEWYAPQTRGGNRRVVAVEIGYKAKRMLDEVTLDRHAYEGGKAVAQVATGSWTTPDKRRQFRVTLALDERGMRGGVERVDLDLARRKAAPRRSRR